MFLDRAGVGIISTEVIEYYGKYIQEVILCGCIVVV
jgi:hypothetical protein